MANRGFRRLRGILVTGLVLSLPAMVTAYILWVGFNWADGLVGRVVRWILGYSVPGLGLVVFIGLIFGVGVIGRNYLGGKLLAWIDQELQHIPIVRSIYGTVRQFLDSFVLGNTGAFREVVLVEYPRRGVYSVGFVTGEGLGALDEVQTRLYPPSERDRVRTRAVGAPDAGSGPAGGDRWVRVFVPTTPNPTSGFLLLLPNREVIRVPLSVEDGMRMVVSGGVLWPEHGPGLGRKQADSGMARLVSPAPQDR